MDNITKAQGFAIAIDGPLGVGKSTVAKMLAHMLNITYIDTGAMYRAVAFYGITNNINIADPTQLENSLQDIDIELRYTGGNQYIYLNGQDISDLIRTQEISNATAKYIAVNETVRKTMVAHQRKMAETGAVVMDGRDIGSHVLPGAQVKIYLDADPKVRAMRRTQELNSKGQSADFDQVLADTIERDTIDKSRPVSPLVQTEDAILIDNTNITPQEVAEEIARIAKEKMKI